MQNTEAQQFLLEILEQAQQGKFTEFRLLTSWYDFKNCHRTALATKLVIRLLSSSAKKLFKEYCKDITAGEQDVNKLLAYTQLCEITSFYERELDTFKRMIDEYDHYLGHGHFWHAFLGGEREL